MSEHLPERTWRQSAQVRAPRLQFAVLISASWRRWNVRGALYLTTLRLVFVSDKVDASGDHQSSGSHGSQSDWPPSSTGSSKPASQQRDPLALLRELSLASCSAGLQAFDLPLSYLRGVKFNQPVFGCNNLAGMSPTYLQLQPWCMQQSQVMKAGMGWACKRVHPCQKRNYPQHITII